MEPIGLQHIEIIHFPSDLVDDVYSKLKESGDDGFERLALSAGTKTGNEFFITQILYPKQTLKKSLYGVSFHVDGDELERLGEWLFQNKLSLIAQIHSHPGEAYHSEADDAGSIITRAGGLSIVVPDFGYSDKHFSRSAFYRLYPKKGWTELSNKEVRTLVKIS